MYKCFKGCLENIKFTNTYNNIYKDYSGFLFLSIQKAEDVLK